MIYPQHKVYAAIDFTLWTQLKVLLKFSQKVSIKHILCLEQGNVKILYQTTCNTSNVYS